MDLRTGYDVWLGIGEIRVQVARKHVCVYTLMDIPVHYRMPILAISSAFSLNACAPLVHTLVPDRAATSGQMQHASGNTGSMEIHYAGNRYVGNFVSESSHHIQGDHQRWPGRIARPVLVASDGAKLACEIQWTSGGDPVGVCKDGMGRSFDVRFD